jgi:hypothetical protein
MTSMIAVSEAVPATGTLIGVQCSACGKRVEAGAPIVDQMVFKLGELAYISILHAACAREKFV